MNALRPFDELAEAGTSEPVFVVTDIGLPRQRVRVLNVTTDQEEVVATDEIRRRVSAGELSIRRPGTPRFTPAMQKDPALDRATSAAFKYLNEIRLYCERYAVSAHQAFISVRETHASDHQNHADLSFPSRATMYRHMGALRNGQPVYVGDANKGNRTPRYSEEVIGLICQNAKAHHQKPGSRWSIGAITEYCNIQAHDIGLLQHGRNISRKFVEKVIFTRLSTDPEINRLLPLERPAQKAVAKYKIRVNGFLQRVEQDAVHLPWRVRTPAGDVQDLYWVHAIDCATGLPVGWAISFGSPNASVSLSCVENILFSKRRRLAAMGLSLETDFYGAPTCIVFDNGPEAKNSRIGSLVRLGIEVQYCKSHHPQHKPYIERLNRSLKSALETLPGCTRMDGEDGKRDPEALGDLPMTLEELEYWIVRWYYEDWAMRPLDRLIRSDFADAEKLGSTPMARYQGLLRLGHAMPLPPNRDDWRRVKYDEQQRVLARTTGVSLDGFQFRGANLARLIALFGENPVTVLVDPEDFRTVLVVNGDELVTLVNADVDEGTPAFSFADAKAMEAAKREQASAEGSVTVRNFRKDLYTTSAGTQKRPAKPGSRAAGKDNRSAQRQSQAVQKAIANPLPMASQPDAPSALADFDLESLPSLAAVNRKTGEAL